MKAAVWRKWIRRVPEIGGLRGMAWSYSGLAKDTDQIILQSIVLWHTRDSVAHTYKSQRKNGVTNIITPEIVRNLINLA
jgi:hypothetical protein